mmetsp:Transcript_70392/g.199585  ORF Transcript_70392/g.199585 Transcript_70392/m.199585 type:complete len:145 (-) Transcript_70392:94-528(-)
MDKNSSLATKLQEAGKAYAVMSKGKTPAQHGLGPPGPIKVAALLKWGKSQGGQLQTECERYESGYWREADQATRARTIRAFGATAAAYDRAKLKLESGAGGEQRQQEAARLVRLAVEAVKGQLLVGAAPRGALCQSIQKTLGSV